MYHKLKENVKNKIFQLICLPKWQHRDSQNKTLEGSGSITATSQTAGIVSDIQWPQLVLEARDQKESAAVTALAVAGAKLKMKNAAGFCPYKAKPVDLMDHNYFLEVACYFIILSDVRKTWKTVTFLGTVF